MFQSDSTTETSSPQPRRWNRNPRRRGGGPFCQRGGRWNLSVDQRPVRPRKFWMFWAKKTWMTWMNAERVLSMCSNGKYLEDWEEWGWFKDKTQWITKIVLVCFSLKLVQWEKKAGILRVWIIKNEKNNEETGKLMGIMGIEPTGNGMGTGQILRPTQLQIGLGSSTTPWILNPHVWPHMRVEIHGFNSTWFN